MYDNELRRRLYVPNFEHWQQICTKKYFSERALEVRTVENGIIIPPPERTDQLGGGVFDRNFKLVAGCDNLYHEKRGADFDITANKKFDRQSIERSEEEIIFGGGLTCHFGHFVSECLSRMWYLIEHPELKIKCAFINLYGWKISRWVYKLFDLLSLPEDRIIFVTKPTQFKSIIVPDQSAYIKEDFTLKFMLPYERIASRIVPRGDVKKLFLTRGRDLSTKNYLANQEYFEEFYRARGFKVVAPEKLSLGEQFALIMGADEIATYLGTLAHWSLFCRPSTKFTMLTRYDTFNTRQCLLLEAHPVDWYIVSTARNVMYAEQGAGVNLLGPTEQWRDYVRDHFGEDISINDRLSPAIVDDYFSHWCKYFSLPQHLQQRIDSVKALYNRMTLLERQVESERPLLCYETHLSKKGWLPASLEGEVNGVLDERLRLQAIRIYFLKPSPIDVQYSVYYPTEGWTEFVGNRKLAGTTGLNKPIHGLKIRLSEPSFDVIYRLHSFGGQWSHWVRNGEKITSTQMLNAVQIKITPRGSDEKLGDEDNHAT